jgi:hypothetical protein
MVFPLIDRLSLPITATISDGPIMGKYECDVTVCENPVCMCKNVKLHLTPIDAEENKVPGSPPRFMDIDLVGKKLEDKKKLPKEDQFFAEAFLGKLTEDDFVELLKLHYLIKNRITEEAPADSIDAYFEYKEIERDGLMQMYTDILPYGDPLYAEIDGKKCIVLDQHCVKPKCNCREVMLDFIHVDEVSKREKELCYIGVDYKKRVWKRQEESPAFPSVDKLRIMVENQIPDFYATLQRRHDRLKAIYAFCRKKNFIPEEPLILPKVGRNDLCPCGSGKKFKKCCADKKV